MKVGTGKYAYEFVENFAKLPDDRYIGMWTSMGGPNDLARDAAGNFYLAEQATAASKHAVSVRDDNGSVLARWEVPPVHGMGIDAAGTIYAGLNKMARVDKYVRGH